MGDIHRVKPIADLSPTDWYETPNEHAHWDILDNGQPIIPPNPLTYNIYSVAASTHDREKLGDIPEEKYPLVGLRIYFSATGFTILGSYGGIWYRFYYNNLFVKGAKRKIDTGSTSNYRNFYIDIVFTSPVMYVPGAYWEMDIENINGTGLDPPEIQD